MTINNPTPDDEEAIALARQKGWRVEGQLEKGEEGTPHFQLIVHTGQVRFSAMKKQFPRAHIEPARNVAALASYVAKEETRVAPLSEAQEKYPSLSRFWLLLYHELSDELGGPADDVDWTRMPDKTKMTKFDEAVSALIVKGYHVETLAVNPQIRSAFAKFGSALMIRTYAGSQTDRQPPQNVACVNIPTADGREAVLQGEDAVETATHSEGSDSYAGPS